MLSVRCPAKSKLRSLRDLHRNQNISLKVCKSHIKTANALSTLQPGMDARLSFLLLPPPRIAMDVMVIWKQIARITRVPYVSELFQIREHGHNDGC